MKIVAPLVLMAVISLSHAQIPTAPGTPPVARAQQAFAFALAQSMMTTSQAQLEGMIAAQALMLTSVQARSMFLSQAKSLQARPAQGSLFAPQAAHISAMQHSLALQTLFKAQATILGMRSPGIESASAMQEAVQFASLDPVKFGRRSAMLHAVAAQASGATTSGKTSAQPTNWTPRKTAWGDPDLEGIWTSDDSIGVPYERPQRYGNRKQLTDEEYAERAQVNNKISTSVEAGVNPHVGYWEQHAGVDAEPYSSNWTEYARQTSRQTSLIVDPEDGHFPPLTQQAMYQRVAAIAAARKREQPESWEDLSMYARCITRGVLGSMLPVTYGNGTDILQAPGLVVIRNEMIHETRIVPIDPPDRPGQHLPTAIRTYMGDPRGHWEGNTLVVDSTNFIGGRVGIGESGDGLRYSDNLRLVERFTRTSDTAIQYEVTVHDSKTFTKPWTVAFPIKHEPGYQIFEYACHEGNYAMANILSEARAMEKAAVTAPAK